MSSPVLRVYFKTYRRGAEDAENEGFSFVFPLRPLRLGGEKGVLKCALNQIEALLDDLTREEQLRFIEEIASRLRQTETRQPQFLFDIWRDQFPADLDIDEALKEIRGGGQKRCSW